MTTKATNVSEGLEPCPFCGSDNVFNATIPEGIVRPNVACMGCGARGPVPPREPGGPCASDKEAAAAIVLWNTRATLSPPLPSPEVERIREALEQQMENEDVQSLPSSICRERGLIWLEGWFDLREALSTSLPSPLGVERLREALEEIVNPLPFMRRQAEAEGNRLSDRAYSIANDAEYLRGIARAALSALPLLEDRHEDPRPVDAPSPPA